MRERAEEHARAAHHRALAEKHAAEATNLDQLISAMEKRHPELREGAPSFMPTPEQPESALGVAEDDHPRGRAAVEAILHDHRGTWMTVGEVVAEMEQRGWRKPNEPRDNPVRNALARSHEAGVAERRQQHGYGSLVYRIPDPNVADDAGEVVTHLQVI